MNDGSVPLSGTAIAVPDRADPVRRAFRVPMLAWVTSVGLLVIAVLASLAVGAVDLPLGGVALATLDALPLLDLDTGLDDRQLVIFQQWRLPRVVLAGLVGASLSWSGAAYQGVFRNPLADPFLLGVGAGAGLGATAVVVFGLDVGWGPIASIPAGAFVGALGAASLAFWLGRLAGGSSAALLLAGVASASFFTAVQTFLQQRNADTLRIVYSWLQGSLGTAGWSEVRLLAPYTVIGGALVVAHRRHLDVLRVGEAEARSLGADPVRIRVTLIVVASLLTAAAVSVSGLISFVGLVVPHAIRLVVGSSYRIVVPLSGLVGAAFLIGADVVARTVLSPAELPIGVVTAFIGAPFFGLILARSRGGFR